MWTSTTACLTCSWPWRAAGTSQKNVFASSFPPSLPPSLHSSFLPSHFHPSTVSPFSLLACLLWPLCCYLVVKSCLTLQPLRPLHARLPCPSPSLRVCSNSCPLSWWCHPTISSSVAFFLFCLQSFPASGSFPVSQLFTSGGQSIGASESTTVLPMNIQGWFPLGWTDYIHCMPFGNFDYENDKSLKMNTWNGQHMWVHTRLE